MPPSAVADQVFVDRVHVVVGRRHGLELDRALEHQLAEQLVEHAPDRACVTSKPVPVVVHPDLGDMVAARRAARPAFPAGCTARRICSGCSWCISPRTAWIWPSATT